jgi:hypothetical protein
MKGQTATLQGLAKLESESPLRGTAKRPSAAGVTPNNECGHYPRSHRAQFALFYSMRNGTTTKASFSLPSILAVLAALGSFASGAFWALILAVLAMVFGLIGVLISLSPNVRGGLMSILSMLAGLLGLGLAVIKMVAAAF